MEEIRIILILSVDQVEYKLKKHRLKIKSIEDAWAVFPQKKAQVAERKACLVSFNDYDELSKFKEVFKIRISLTYGVSSEFSRPVLNFHAETQNVTVEELGRKWFEISSMLSKKRVCFADAFFFYRDGKLMIEGACGKYPEIWEQNVSSIFWALGVKNVTMSEVPAFNENIVQPRLKKPA